MTFGEFKQKDIINISDGKRLGRAVDLILTCTGDHACIEAVVVPGQSCFLRLFRAEKDGVAIAWDRIRRIGDDVILVDVDTSAL